MPSDYLNLPQKFWGLLHKDELKKVYLNNLEEGNMFKIGDSVSLTDSAESAYYSKFGFSKGVVGTVMQYSTDQALVKTSTNELVYVPMCFLRYANVPDTADVLSKKSVENEGKKLDAGKPGMDLLPYDALVEIAKVLDFGAKKYSPGNWSKGIQLSRLISAAERHIGEFKEGRDIDPESNLNHIAHAACNLLFILWTQKHNPDMDNRWIKEANKKLDSK